MAISESAVERVRELFCFVPDLTTRRMFGALGVYAAGRIFAVADEETIYLKVDSATEAAFRAAGSAPFVYDTGPDGTPLTMRYWNLPDEALDDEDSLRRWTALALDAAARASARGAGKARPKPSEDLLISGPWDDDG